MKPHVICHMVASVDGRTLISRWRPEDAHRRGVFDRLHELLGGDAWLVGRITGQEYARRDAYPEHTDQRYPREPWFARRDAAAYGVVLDAHGKIAWGRTDIGDDPIVAVLTAQVSDAHAADARQRTSSLAASWAGYGVVSGRSPPSPRSIRAGAVVPILKWSTR